MRTNSNVYYNYFINFSYFVFQRMDDTFGPVRDAAAEALGILLKLIGEKPMNPYVDKLDKIKAEKVRSTPVAFPQSGSSSTESNWNLEMLIFVEGGKPENLEKNT
jgi:hypothetical protein